MDLDVPDSIQWRLNLASSKEEVYRMLATDEGRRQFWAEESKEVDGTIGFIFVNGLELRSRVIEKRPPERFAVEYFGGSTVRFDLAEDGAGGTDLILTESGVPEAHRSIHLAGWVSVLLALKAATDFSVDLRNRDPLRTWDHGYVDV